MLLAALIHPHVCSAANAVVSNATLGVDHYLFKPSGKYKIAFEDFHATLF